MFIPDQTNMQNMLDKVNYPRSSMYYLSYSEYIKAPIKLFINVHLPRGFVMRQEKRHEDDLIIDEVYIPHDDNVEYIKKRLFEPLDGLIVFNDDRNTGSDILGDHYLLYKTEPIENCVKNADGSYYIPHADLNERGIAHTKRFRIYPHKGHKCVADLMKWAQCYKFDEAVQGWVYDENKRNHVVKYLKGVLKLRIADEVGDTEERISDYSKLIYWLMWQHKDKLSEKQTMLLEGLLPTEDQITKVLQRDNLVYRIMGEVLNENIPSHYEFEL